MRSLALWSLGAGAAFAITASAFLLLATIGSGVHERKILPQPPAAPAVEPSLELHLAQAQLKSLKPAPDQPLTVTVNNQGKESLSNINLTLKVASENTAASQARYYRATLEELAAGAGANVEFALDLSRPGFNGNMKNPQSIIEIQATTPAGITAVKTVVLKT